MRNPLESIKNLIKKMWSQAPSMASRDLLELFHTSPRTDPVRFIAKNVQALNYSYTTNQI